ncbi:MAG: IPT/TIG domain-containing protein, partial [Acidaminobacteraceae bacterium]
TIHLVDPTPPENKGYQNIKFSKLTTNDNGTVGDTSDDYTTEVNYLYAKGFRFIENVGLTGVEMFPNVGNINDLVYIDADIINNTKEYAVFFLKETDNTDKFSDANKAIFVGIENPTTGKDRLIVKVPNIGTGNYRVFVTNTLNGEVIAEQQILDVSSNAVLYTVVQSSISPNINKVTPSEGPDSGQDVQLDVTNLLTLALPDLVVPSDGTLAFTGENSDKTLDINYNAALTPYKFKNKDVTINRKIKVIIGNETTFVKRTNGTFIATKGNPDIIQVNTGIFTDAETNPNKDIKIEVVTTITETIGGKIYTFKQEASKIAGYKAIPSTLTPVVTTVTPEKIQLKTADNTLQNKTQFTIKGDKFIVDRYVDSSGKVILKYPAILFKQDGTNSLTDSYQLGFFPNIVSGSSIGQIKWKLQDDSTTENILMNGPDPLSFEMLVVNDENVIVDGTDGNNEGTKIILIMPEVSNMNTLGSKSIQVINVRRGSTDFGFSSVAKDVVEFVRSNDIPVITSVVPNIVTVDGGNEITVRGSNFQDGVKLFLDGEEMTGLTREISGSGDEIILKFIAPAGREGETQLLIMNPSGASDIYTFIYVKTFAKDPEFTSFAPAKGTEGTYVIINGDNFLKADPTATSTTGYEGFRLIGTRVYIDGRDVNDYNKDGTGNILYQAYTVPATNKFISVKSNLLKLTSFEKNVTITGPSSKVYFLSNDKDNNPQITDNENVFYNIKYESGVFKAYDKDNIYLADATITDSLGTDTNYASDGITKVTVNTVTPASFTIKMDNNILRMNLDVDNNKKAELSDYATSVALADGNGFYSLSKDLNGDIKLSNRKDIIYTITYDDINNKFIAKTTDVSTPITVTPSSVGIQVGSLNLTMQTPYALDATTNKIIGNRTKVITKDQIGFYVPKLLTGKGLKDLKVVNPDTKSASKTGADGFYYVVQASSNPVITTIEPNKGSVSGGYNIIIKGKSFEDDVKVYIDSVLVPSSDTFPSIDGTSIVVKVPATSKDLREDYDVDRFTVPVVILNSDGGTASEELGFTYIIPVSSPNINKVTPLTGSSNGGEIVEIFGYEFRYYEPYTDEIGGPEYNIGDPYQDLFGNGVWDDILSSSYDTNAVTTVTDSSIKIFGYYYNSKILPTIYFGEKTGKIVEYSKGYIKVISPPHDEGNVNIYVVNNDLGITNKINYTYKSSSPTLTKITPNKGKKSGQELKELYGSSLYSSQLKGYYNNDASSIVTLPDVQALVRFGDIDNAESVNTDSDYGQINNQIASVDLDGGLKVEYRGATDQLMFTHEENGKIYTRTFSNYTDTEVFVPMEMLQNAGNYYVPNGLRDEAGTSYTNGVFEYVKVYVKDKRLVVERGYAPKVTYDNSGHVSVRTPSYYTIDPVDVTYYNTDGGDAKITFTYTNPASFPKILKVEPNALSPDTTHYMVEGSTQGGIEIEILGLDFRANAIVKIGDKLATVVDQTEKLLDGVIYDVIIVKTPVGSATDVNKKEPIVVENADAGLATSSTLSNLLDPIGGATKKPFYFIYRKPLSLPTITSVSPEATSVFGGNPIVITGSDFRAGAIVIIGAKGGIPVTNVTIENQGSVIKFTLPSGITLGEKTVQVLNADFGLATKEKGLKIVSNPDVDGSILNEDGTSSISRLSVEGGQKIRISGTEFYENAKVVFGGTRTEKTALTTGEFGLFTNDKYYVVEGGSLATSVEYIDKNTLLVTTPQIREENEVIITVINDDSGISDGLATVKYTEPIPSDPIGLKAKIVNDRYVELYDYISDSVEYYEIYYFLGNKSATTLMSNKYQDFKYLDVTNLEPYKVKDIPGYENREKTDKLWFVLKAVNKFGPSNYSNFASIDWKILNEVEVIGPIDEDGGIGVPDGKTYTQNIRNDTLTLNLSSKERDDIFISLAGLSVDKYPNREVLIPKDRVSNDNSLVTVDYGDSKIQFMPINLNTTQFRQLYTDGANYGRIINSVLGDINTSMAISELGRGLKPVSRLYKINFAAINQTTIKNLSSLNGNIDLEISYTDSSIGSYKESTLGLYYFDGLAWRFMSSDIDKLNNKVTARISKPGMYILLVKVY